MPKLSFLLSMFIFGTLGLFVRAVSLPSSVLACARSVLGTLFLLAVFCLRRMPPHRAAVRRNAPWLVCSGAALGFNWILLFEAYRYTTVAVATLCYYMAPVFVLLLSPLVLGERLTRRQVLCTLCAVAGAALVSGATQSDGESARGVPLALMAALLYASVILLNKKIRGLGPLETTLCQLGVSAVTMTGYVLLTQNLAALAPTPRELAVTVALGVVHTGAAYWLFFGAVGRLPAQTSAMLSYIDPLTAILLSALLLRQPMSLAQAIGAVLILGAAVADELRGKAR